MTPEPKIDGPSFPNSDVIHPSYAPSQLEKVQPSEVAGRGMGFSPQSSIRSTVRSPAFQGGVGKHGSG